MYNFDYIHKTGYMSMSYNCKLCLRYACVFGKFICIVYIGQRHITNKLSISVKMSSVAI